MKMVDILLSSDFVKDLEKEHERESEGEMDLWELENVGKTLLQKLGEYNIDSETIKSLIQIQSLKKYTFRTDILNQFE